MYIIKAIIFELLIINAYGELTIADIVLPKDPNTLFLEKLRNGEINFEKDIQLGLGFNLSEIFNIGEIFQNNNPTDYFQEKLKNGKLQLPPNFGLDIYKFLKNYGYPVETHWVQTEDGYVLRMHRVAGRNGTKGYMAKRDRPAVLFVHGLASSSFHWVVAGPNKSLALQLADQGFDVWLGNTRGNTWSRQHITLNPDIDHEAFWQFSYEQCGQYDLPAKIDYIIAKTGQQKIFYVGHSQGTSIFFAMAALRPEYNDKIALFTAFAPVVYLKHMSSPMYRFLVKYMDKVEVLIKNIYELMSYNWLSARIQGLLCLEEPFSQFCLMERFFLSGFDPYQVDQTQIALETAQSPNGISKNMLLHFGQNIRSGFFQRFDYGPELNQKLYQSSIPPNFTLSHVTVPTALYYAQNDLFVPVKAVEQLTKELPNVVKSKLISFKYFNHMDFVNAVDVNKLVNNDAISLIKTYVDNGGTTTPAPPPGNSPAAAIKFNYGCILMIILLALYS
ncbi:unnamed protein product [Phyllotreta striolata]|uniref:AB hydrolase-1 domain-containing protein n=1 Tax=Phyllotreta striolata TaxID=444603 RepID=A0A9N9T9X6_PHYSR|nr:unnamed protein product [Phyllotreta striolata]